MARPGRLVLVVGTGTGVGKTWVGAALLTELRARGVRVAARKPVQSADPDDGSQDADVLAAASGEPVVDVCPPRHSFGVPMTPFMAAEVLGRRMPSLRELVGGLAWAEDTQVGLVESVGGVRSPITADGGDSVTLGELLRPDLTLLVADAGLGTLNLVRLSAGVLPRPAVVLLNRFEPGDDLHRRNRAWLAGQLDGPVVASIGELAEVVLGRP